MIQQITRLLAGLRRLEIDSTPEEIADALWLASVMTLPTTISSTQEPEAVSPVQKQGKGERKMSDIDISPDRLSASSRFKLYPDQRKKWLSEDKPVVAGGLSFRSPGSPALPHTLLLSRALRPFMRRYPSRTDEVMDETATARFIANNEAYIWMPVLRPALERWFDVALVVDTSPSMRLWHQSIVEIQRLLERMGAFRDVRKWYLDTENPEAITLKTSKNANTRKPKEILDPTGRRLILVVTDCVGLAWYNPQVVEVLEAWARVNSVALLQILPQHLWSRTALDRATLVRLGSLYPGVPNAQLKRKPISPYALDVPGQGTGFPILLLRPDYMRAWAELVTGSGTAWPPGVILRSGAIPPEDKSDLPSEVSLQQFRRDSTPVAFRLVSLLAAAPLRLPIMRLVQRALLPHSRQSHLAEVFLSGLVYRTGPVMPDPDEIDYDFLPGVREALLETGLVPDMLQVQRVVSRYIEEHYGQALDFDAMLIDPEYVETVSLSSQLRPFATVAVDLLKQLGGKYADAAMRLQRRIEPGTSLGKSFPREELPSEPVTEAPSSDTLEPIPNADLDRIRPKTAKAVQVEVVGLSVIPNSESTYMLVLGEIGGKRKLPIPIGSFEAQAIALELKRIQPPRPMTHDLFLHFRDQFDIHFYEVWTNELRDGTFYAYIICQKNNLVEAIDARPSDSVAIALRMDIPIFVTEEVMQEASISTEEY